MALGFEGYMEALYKLLDGIRRENEEGNIVLSAYYLARTYVGKDHKTVGRMLAWLHNKGYIKIEVRDNLHNTIVLTEKGKKLLEALKE